MADVTITAASVLADASADTEMGTAGATITAGQVVYKDSSDSNKFKLADANGAAALRVAYGIALNGASAGQPLKVLKAGLLTVGGTVVVGTIYILSATAGGIAPSTDAATGMYISVLGVATTAGILTVKINVSGVAVP